MAIVLVAIWLRCYLLGNIPGVNGDEAWYGVQAWNIFHGGPVEWNTPSGNPLNPLFVGPLALAHLWLPPSFVLLRSMALASGLAALAINWFFCCWAFDRRTAAVSTVALAILPINIAYSRFAWDASQSLAATLPVLYCALAAVKGTAPIFAGTGTDQHVGPQPWSAKMGLSPLPQGLPMDRPNLFGRWIAAATLALGVAVWVHPTNLFAGAAIAAACLAHWRRASLLSGADIPVCRRARDLFGKQECLPSLMVLLLAAVLLAAWIWAARPTHALLAQHVAERIGDVRQLDQAGNLPSVFVLFARLFTGGTIYRYLAGSRSWFEWPLAQGADGMGIDVAVFWLCATGSAWLVWRSSSRHAPCAATADRVLLVAWALQLAAFFIVAGPQAMVPGQERFSICLLATTVLLLSRGAVALWEIASKRWRIVLAAATLIAWPLSADFHTHYFRFIERSGGQAHLTFRTAAIEPKQAAFRYILDDANGTGPVWIVASQWWNRCPIRYLASGDPRICVAEPSELSESDDYRQAVAEGRAWYVEFFNTAAQHEVESKLSGRCVESQTFPDYAGRPLLSVLHAEGR